MQDDAIILKCIRKFKGAPPKGLSKFHKCQVDITNPGFRDNRYFEKLRKSRSLDDITRLCLGTRISNACYVRRRNGKK